LEGLQIEVHLENYDLSPGLALAVAGPWEEAVIDCSFPVEGLVTGHSLLDLVQKVAGLCCPLEVVGLALGHTLLPVVLREAGLWFP